MKLLYFTIQINMLGGLAKIVIEKINWLVAHGYDVTLCNIERMDVLPAYPIDNRVKLVRGDISTTPGNALIRLRGVLAAVKRVKSIIQEEKPDVIINAHCPLVTWILPWIKNSFKFKVSGSKFKYKRPLMITEIHQSRQGLEIFNTWAMNGFSRWLHRWSIRWIYGKYDKFVVLTKGDKDAWNLNNCVVIPNFSSFNENEMLRYENENKGHENEKAETKHQIIVLARLMPQKRIDLMMRVWAKVAKDFPDWHVKVLGDGMLKEDLETLANKLGVQDSFLMPGGVKDVTAELESSDILCLTSEYEGFGIVLIEAMLKGVPVMAFEYVGVHDIIEDGVDGYIVPFGDVNLYAEKLRRLMTDKDERLRLRNNAFKSVRKFDKETVMHKWIDLFDNKI